MIRFLLLRGIEWTDANPWVGLVGMVVCIALAGMLEPL